jgi:PLD-like domain
VLDGLVRKASEAHFPRAIKAGVKIHECGPALLHAKTLVVDERLVSIGSANLDNRLFALNNELNVVFQDGVIAAQLIKVFHQDLKLARAVDNDSVRRGWSGIFYLALLRSATSSKAAGWSWWRWEELNLRHGAYETPALPLSYTADPRKSEELQNGSLPRTFRSCPKNAPTERGSSAMNDARLRHPGSESIGTRVRVANAL